MDSAKKDFTVITPTGDRPESFAICCHLMKQQTIKPTEWIVMDDGKVEQKVPRLSFLNYIKRKRKKNELQHTLPVQLRRIIELVTTDKVIVMEDDDWYDREYFERTLPLLDQFDLVGLQDNQYYFLQQKEFFIHRNKQWSSFCSTAFTRLLFRYVAALACGSNPYIDLHLYKMMRKQDQKVKLYVPPRVLVLGMKEMPGRVGITYDSNRSCLQAGTVPDHNLEYLKSIVGKDLKWYERLICSPVLSH